MKRENVYFQAEINLSGCLNATFNKWNVANAYEYLHSRQSSQTEFILRFRCKNRTEKLNFENTQKPNEIATEKHNSRRMIATKLFICLCFFLGMEHTI